MAVSWVLAKKNLRSLYNFSLLMLSNRNGGIAEAVVAAIADLNKNKTRVLDHDQVYFTEPAMKI